MAADGRNNCNGNYNGNVKSVGRGFTRILNGETARIRQLQLQGLLERQRQNSTKRRS